MIVKHNESLQLKRLKESVKTARNSDFYKNKLDGIEINSLDDIKNIPITGKKGLREAGAYGLVSVPEVQLAEYHESFGTTGKPVSSWRTENDCRQVVKVATANGINFYPEDKVMIRNPYALSAPAHEMQTAARQSGASVIPVSTRSDVVSHRRTVKLMKKLQPTIITCIALEGFVLAETAEQMGLDPKKDFPKLRAFYCAGELLTPKRRKLLEETWGIDVYVYYGTTELSTIASDCREEKVLHPCTENFLFEVVDPETKKSVGKGERGLLLVTTLAREAQPIFRFNTGDIVKIKDEKCSCGSKQPILKHFGRYEDRVTIKDKTLLFGELQDLVYSLPVNRFWMGIVKEGELEIKIETDDPTEEVNQDLVKKLREKYNNFPFTVTMVSKGEVYSRNRLLDQSYIGKPAYISDWRNEAKFNTLNQLFSQPQDK